MGTIKVFLGSSGSLMRLRGGIGDAVRQLSQQIVNDNVKVYQKIIQKYTISTECCKGTKSLLYITYC
jgi:hypothetical protein